MEPFVLSWGTFRTRRMPEGKCQRLGPIDPSSRPPGWRHKAHRGGTLLSGYPKIPNGTWVEGHPIAHLQGHYLQGTYELCRQELGDTVALRLLPFVWILGNSRRR